MGNFILELMKVSIWPLLIFISGFYFRKNIAAFMDRIYQIKFPGGGELNAVQQQKELKEETI